MIVVTCLLHASINWSLVIEETKVLKKPSRCRATFVVNSWGEIWKTFEDIDVRLVELGIDEIMEGDDV